MDQHETQLQQKSKDNRLRTDPAELAWLSQLPGSVVPANDDTSAESVAGRILPELRELIQARTLMLMRQPNTPSVTESGLQPMWTCGEQLPPSVIAPLISQHAADAMNAGGVSLDFTTPTSSSASRNGIVSAIVMPVRWPGRTQGWLVAANKDLRRLAMGEVTSRYGSEIQTADIQFGPAEFSLVQAASTVFATNSGVHKLLSDREELLTGGVIRTLVNALDAKDSYTCGHSDRVAEFAYMTAHAMGINEEECEQIYMTGLVHDIGKVGVPDQILNKTSPVTEEEMELIRQHPVIGHDILKHLSSFKYVLPGVLHHHEAFDGTGYPMHLTGDAIPLSARILAVVDAWDAMTSNRSYRSGMSPDQATSILINGSGFEWDPMCVTAFMKCEDAVRIRMDMAKKPDKHPRLARLVLSE